MLMSLTTQASGEIVAETMKPTALMMAHDATWRERL